MLKNRDKLKILLLQIRNDQATMIEEFYEFVQFSGLRQEQFTVLNVLQTQNFEATLIDNFDALFIGGSSDVSVISKQQNSFLTNSNNLLQRCYDSNIPVFASCFGFQMAIAHFGGEVEEKIKEMGIYPISLTEEGKKDNLLHDLPDPFWSAVGHFECAISLPQEAILLAYSKECPIHSFKIKNKPFYAFQFHPEMTGKDLWSRLKRYQDNHPEFNYSLDYVEKSLCHSTEEINKLLSRFIDRIVLKI